MEFSKNMSGPDLSSLPDEVLIHLFRVLPLPERGRLASCCRRLSAVMNCASVWRDVSLELELVMDVPLKCRNQEGIVQRDWNMITKYGRHFQNVSVVMNTGCVESRSLKMLTTLCRRQVIKRVTLSYALLLCKLGRLILDSPQSLIACMFSLGMTITAVTEAVEPGFFDILRPDAHFTLELPHQLGHIDNMVRYQLYKDFADHYFSPDLYYTKPKSKKFCTLLKKLILSTNPASEQEISRMCPKLPSGSPTATLISTFPNLQELHVNIINLSDQLLQELSSPQRHTPLRSLVIRHIDLRPQPSPDDMIWEVILQSPENPVKGPSFPQLSPAAWKQLAKASPSLKVECCVVVADELPELSEIIRPETPLVKLKVVCGRAEEESVVRLYQDLGQNHHETLEDLELSMGSETNRLHTERMQGHWKDMALACSRMWHLVCDVDLHHQHLDEVRDSRLWKTFRFNPSRVITTEDGGGRCRV